MKIRFSKVSKFTMITSVILVVSLLGAVIVTKATTAEKQNVYNLMTNDESYINVKDKGAVGDGVTDDTAAIEATLKEVHGTTKVAYFPEGIYLVKSTINLPYSYGANLTVYGAPGGEKGTVKIVGDPSLNGAILKTDMRSGLNFTNITMEHNGNGSCVDTLFMCAYNCTFKGAASNNSNLVIFSSSSCRIANCTFDCNNADAYGLAYTKRADVAGQAGSSIAINSYIIDNEFVGTGKGLLLNCEGDNHRVEGLKINGNKFTNTGAEQMRIETVLHCDVSDNILENSGGIGIAIIPEGLLVHGLYVCGNKITNAAEAAISLPAGSKGSTILTICDNIISGGKLGINLAASTGTVLIDNNTISGVSGNGIVLLEAANGIITNNRADKIDTGSNGDNYVIADNS